MKLNYYSLLALLLVMASCDKELESVSTPNLDITLSGTTFKVNDDIPFRCVGTATEITFYPGTENANYEYRNGRVLDVSGSGVELSFQTAVSVANAALQNNHLKVLVSTNFNGKYDFASLKSATWTDITNRFVINGTSTTFTPAGAAPIDITDLFPADRSQPLYFAFQYTTRSQAANGLAREHWIQSFLLNSKAAKPTGVTKALTIADQYSAAFKIIDENPVNAPARALISNTRLTMKGNIYKDPTNKDKDPTVPIYNPADPIFDPANPIYDPKSALFQPNKAIPKYVPFDPASPWNDPVSEHWAVTRPLFIKTVDLGKDVPVTFKGMTNQQSDKYFYKYTAPGTYKAVFVYSNHNISSSNELTKEFTITITP